MFKFSRVFGNPKDFQFPLPKTDSVGLGWRPGLCICDSGTSARSLPPSLYTLYLVRSDTGCKQVPGEWTGQQQGSLERAESPHSCGHSFHGRQKLQPKSETLSCTSTVWPWASHL